MQIHDTKEQDRIMMNVSELCDGITIFQRQGLNVLDCHACFGVDSEDDEFYFVTEYTHKSKKVPDDMFNFSYMTKFDNLYSEYEQTSVSCYTTREEMHAHIARFIADNHF